MLEDPAAGKGRLSILFGGNRRWCTFTDDRIVRPPATQSRVKPTRRGEVHTFGYQFTIAAIRRGEPDRALMLFESPIIRTASMRRAVKVGGQKKRQVIGPGMGGSGRPSEAPLKTDSPDNLVPYWQERYRCTTLDESFDFDMMPGSYDVYAAFDIMDRQGRWVHRTVAFLEEVPVESDRRTLLEGVLNGAGRRRREMELLKATLQDAEPPGQAVVP
jgi:hypothetical protein